MRRIGSFKGLLDCFAAPADVHGDADLFGGTDVRRTSSNAGSELSDATTNASDLTRWCAPRPVCLVT